MERVRLVDVAREAGVHPATASRALNPAAHDEVSRDTIRRVELAARRLGYVPNTLARGLRTSRSLVVALVIPDITNPLFPPIVRGAEQVLSAAGFTLVLTDTNNDPATEHSQVTAMRGRGVDGFIVATARWHDPVVDGLAKAGVPTILVNRRNDPVLLPYIGGDDRSGMRACVDHLADLGHQAILHLSGPAETSTALVRSDAFRSAMLLRGLSTRNAEVHCTAYTEDAGAAGIREALSAGSSFTAVAAANDLLALGAQRALAERGLCCPADVSITGYNDINYMSKLSPPFTTVRLPLRKIGMLAARNLLGWIGGQEPELGSQVLLPVEFMKRGTTAPPPGHLTPQLGRE
jgi:LacI family transcriptional regulator